MSNLELIHSTDDKSLYHVNGIPHYIELNALFKRWTHDLDTNTIITYHE